MGNGYVRVLNVELTPKQINTIRSLKGIVPIRHIATRFGIGPDMVSRILKGDELPQKSSKDPSQVRDSKRISATSYE